jgi:hypothetical protein
MKAMWRLFITAPDGTTVVGEWDRDLDVAFDILAADGADMEKMLPMLLAARDQEKALPAFAEHLVRLRRAARRAR